MLTCALIVWVLHPDNWSVINLRNTYLTKQECLKEIKKNYKCIEIDKRYGLTKQEWNKDSCNISDHIWVGQE